MARHTPFFRLTVAPIRSLREAARALASVGVVTDPPALASCLATARLRSSAPLARHLGIRDRDALED